MVLPPGRLSLQAVTLLPVTSSGGFSYRLSYVAGLWLMTQYPRISQSVILLKAMWREAGLDPASALPPRGILCAQFPPRVLTSASGLTSRAFGSSLPVQRVIQPRRPRQVVLFLCFLLGHFLLCFGYDGGIQIRCCCFQCNLKEIA